MNNCIYCSSILSAKGVFCLQCAKQSKCKNCDELLEVNARACATCGTLIGEGNVKTTNQTNQNNFDNVFELVETFEFEGRKNSRNMRLGCSNEAVSNFGDFVERRMRGVQRIDNNVSLNNELNETNALPPAKTPEDVEDFEENQETIEIPQIQNPVINNNSSDLQILQQIFRKSDNKWKLDEPELNAKNKIDYARRITYLFLYFCELEGKSKTPRSELNSILEDSTVYDGNFRDWLSNEISIDKNDDETLTLNAGGRRNAKDCIKNLSEIPVGKPWLPGSATKGSSKTSSPSKETKSTTKKVAGGKNPRTSVIIEKWRTLDYKFHGHKLFSEKTVFDKGLLGLWAIRKATKDEVKVVSSGQIANFLFEVFEIKVHKRSLESAFENKNVKDKVTKESSTSFQILPPGSEYVEKIIGI